MFLLVGPMHYSRNSQILFLAKFSLKLSPTVLFTHLKVILLQCFQFSAISGIQIDREEYSYYLFLFFFGENTILVSTFWGYGQFGPYILVAVNLVPIIFNL